METLTIRTSRREEFIDITAKIKELIEDNDWRDGFVLLHCPHTTAGLTINEAADPSVVKDIAAALAKLAPRDGAYTHAEGNSDAHIKSVLTGTQLTLIVEGGKPALGNWQGVFFCEYDGPRTRRVWAAWLATAK